MSDLDNKACVPCRGGVPALTDDQLAPFLSQTPGWRLVEKDGVRRIERAFSFDDFQGALDFTVKVGALAEREQHHPEIHLAWGKAVVEIWTHKIRGLHENDFILAAKTNRIYEGAGKR